MTVQTTTSQRVLQQEKVLLKLQIMFFCFFFFYTCNIHSFTVICSVVSSHFQCLSVSTVKGLPLRASSGAPKGSAP